MDEKIKVTNKCPICGRSTYKESKYCIFHASAEEKTEKEFKEALKEYVNNIKKEDGDYDFKKFIFVGDIDFKKNLNITVFINTSFKDTSFKDKIIRNTHFKEANFFFPHFDKATFGHAYFDNATFNGHAHFTGAKFYGHAYFGNATFNFDAYFDNATFNGNTYFEKATFNGNTYFEKATFNGYTDFDEATLKDAYFGNATFKGNTRFGNATFNGHTDFDEATLKDAHFDEATFNKISSFFATFKGNTSFDNATFNEHVYFNGANFKGDASFYRTTFNEGVDFILKYLSKGLILREVKAFPGKKFSIHIKNGKGIISFERAYLENMYLDIELVTGVLIDFTDALLRDTRIEKDKIKNRIIQEKEKKFSEAKKIYLLLKNNFHSLGQYDDESWAFGKEKEMERKSICHIKTLHKWFWSCFLNLIYGYGEKPERVFLSAVLIVLIFACIFMNCGIASPPLDNLPKYNILKELSMGILYGDLLNKYKAIPREQITKSLYFSAVTFTTLGLGDFRPVDNKGRIFVGLEAFIGAFMMALFVYTFARRTGGR